MTGVDIVTARLAADAAVTARVPIAQIKAGALAENAALPSLLVRSISRAERQPLKPGALARWTERVSVTVRAASYRDQVAIMKLLPAAGRGVSAELAGATGVSVLTAGTHPDVRGPGNSFEQSQDFRVSYDVPA